MAHKSKSKSKMSIELPPCCTSVIIEELSQLFLDSFLLIDLASATAELASATILRPTSSVAADAATPGLSHVLEFSLRSLDSASWASTLALSKASQ